MKTTRFPLSLLALTFSTFLFAAGASAQQSILLTVDISDPAQVTFTATTGTALNTNTAETFDSGIDLLSFFTADSGDFGQDALSSNLTTFIDGSPSYSSATNDDFNGGAFVDLNLYNQASGSATEDFAMGTQAFEFPGSLTLDLTALSPTLLPAVGFIGDIYAGYNGIDLGGGPGSEVFGTNVDPYAVLIGQYLVIPEAGPGRLLLAGGAILMVGRSLRRRFAAA